MVLGRQVLAEASLRRYILHVADGQPHRPGRGASVQRVLGGYAADLGQHQAGSQRAGIARTKFVIHQTPEITQSHWAIVPRTAAHLLCEDLWPALKDLAFGFRLESREPEGQISSPGVHTRPGSKNVG